MTSDSKRVVAAAAVEVDSEDRISALPKNIIDDILCLLPVCDAARTSILSRSWRYIWAGLPNLVLDKQFWDKLAEKSQFVFKETVDGILLLRRGDIVKFDLDVSGVKLYSRANVDRWIHYVTINGVKKLTLNMSKYSNYSVPSYVFNCLTLRHLKLFNCVFKPPSSFLGFQNLIYLHLEKVTFEPNREFCVIDAPCLVNLILLYCIGTQYLDIVVSSRLKLLVLYESHHSLDLNCFMKCKKLTYLHLVVDSRIPTDARSTYEKLIFSLSTLETLTLGSFVVELLGTGNVVTKRRPFTLMNCLLQLVVHLHHMSQTSCALQLIKSFPNLSKLHISVCAVCDTDKTVMKYLEESACLDRPLHKLKEVIVRSFRGSKSELLLIKLLFARTPSLVRMDIKQKKAFGTREKERNITKELMRFPRASPMAELFYSIDAN